MTASPLPDGPAPASLSVVVMGAAATPAGSFAQAVGAAAHEVRHCESVGMLLRLVLSKACDVVVVYLEDAQEAMALSRWFAGRRPSTRLVFSCGPDSKLAIAPLIDANAAVVIWAGKTEQEQLDDLSGIPKRAGLVGRFLEIELVDYLQIVALNTANKLVRVESPQGSGYIWFERGKIVHAEFGSLDAEPAFYALVSPSHGSFCELGYQPPPRTSIEVSNTHLIMEASRLKDEARTESAFQGLHALDDELYNPLLKLDASISQHGSGVSDEDVEEMLLDELMSANDIEILPDGDSEFLDWAASQAGVVEVDSVALTEDISKEFPQELRDWGRRVLFILQCRVSKPTSVLSQREGKNHFVGVVYRDALVVVSVSPEQDVFELRDKLLEKAGQS